MKPALALLTILLLCAVISAQAQRFRLGGGIGANLSQMDGDGFSGYDKLGLRAGLRTEVYLAETIDLIVEMNYEEKGSRFESQQVASGTEKRRLIDLRYAEIPIMLRFFRRNRHNLFVETGVSISYLLSSDFLAPGEPPDVMQIYEQISTDFNRYEWNAVLGGGLIINNHWGLTLRTSIGFSYLFRDLAGLEAFRRSQNGHVFRPGIDDPVFQLRNYLISLGTYYML
jgi:hypothetical protein